MSTARHKREAHRQLGRFYTPATLAGSIVAKVPLRHGAHVLEPSCGDGSFLRALRERSLQDGLELHVTGVDIDPAAISAANGALLPGDARIRLEACDFLEWSSSGLIRPMLPASYGQRVRPEFDVIIGNPPFGGTIRGDLHDPIDRVCGVRLGEKIKKETYSLFIVKSIDHLRAGGRLVFICSDTLLTINTMRGLRLYLQRTGRVTVEDLPYFSGETSHPMIILTYEKGVEAPAIVVNGKPVPVAQIERTANLSWRVNADYAKLFTGPTVGDKLVATSGMTIGDNDLFVREVRPDGTFEERFEFGFFEEPVTLRREIERARNGILSAPAQSKILDSERRGEVRRNVRAVPRNKPLAVRVPHPDYRPYNKATSSIIYAPPKHYIYWKDEGDAVYTFKKNGPWYLHGVGGKKYFGREGITWQLIAPRLRLKYLPSGYILDSGAPCAFVRHGVPPDELFFLMGWGLTTQANDILKTVLNHTRNIQGKDFERLPYPWWIGRDAKSGILARVRMLIARAMDGVQFDESSPEVRMLDQLFAFFPGESPGPAVQGGSPPRRRKREQLVLL